MGRTVTAGVPKISALGAVRHLRNPLKLLDKLCRDDRSLVQLPIPRQTVLLVAEPDLVGQVWAGSRTTFLRTGMMWDEVAKLQGERGLAKEGQDWQPSRSAIEPMLSPAAIRRMHPVIADAITRAGDNLARRTAHARRPMSLVAEMRRVAHTVLGAIFFGSRLDPEAAYEVGEAVESSFRAMSLRVAVPGLPQWLPVPGDRAHRAAVRKADRVVYPLVSAARVEPQSDDIISMLAHVMDDRLARNNVVGLITGGTETTATALAWTLIALQQHPQVAARLQVEVDEVVGGSGQSVQVEHISALRYTGMVLDEALRLFPPAWVLPRQVTVEVSLGDAKLRPGDTVVVSPYMAHRLDRWWPEPRRFDPDRWLPDVPRASKWSYFPFGGGVHRCIGAHLFRTEAILALAELYSRFRITVRTPRGIRPRGSIALQPRDPAYIEVVPRAALTS